MSRNRYLEDQEIKTIWSALEEQTNGHGQIMQLILLTCQRPGEIMSMKWADIDFKKKLWRQGYLDDNKTRRIFLVPLTQQVLKILYDRKQFQAMEAKRRSKRYKIPEENFTYVFHTFKNATRGTRKNQETHTSEIKETRYSIWNETGVRNWTAHDLRRTARTKLSELKVPRDIRERALNHAMGKIEGTYDMWDFIDEKLIALEKLANEIDRIIETEKK